MLKVFLRKISIFFSTQWQVISSLLLHHDVPGRAEVTRQILAIWSVLNEALEGISFVCCWRLMLLHNWKTTYTHMNFDTLCWQTMSNRRVYAFEMQNISYSVCYRIKTTTNSVRSANCTTTILLFSFKCDYHTLPPYMFQKITSDSRNPNEFIKKRFCDDYKK